MTIRETFREFFRPSPPEPAKRNLPITLDQYIQQMSYLGHQYGVLNQTLPGTSGEEKIPSNFAGVVQQAAKANGIVGAAILARMLLFQEARFMFRELLDNGRPGDFKWDDRLKVLEKPQPGWTTGDLLARCLQYADIAGTAFLHRRNRGDGNDRIVPLRPDWVTIAAGSPNEDASVWDLDAEVIGYLYQPGGPSEGRKPVFLDASTVMMWTPDPDPVARWRGKSWVQGIVAEVEADQAATLHKRAFFANGATPNMIVHLDPDIIGDDLDKFNSYVDAMEAGHAGALNAYRTLYITGATSAEVVGTNLQQLDFKNTQGAGETRIALAARVPAVILGISEGLGGSALNSGNYDSAFRQFADLTMRPLWRNFAGSLEHIVPPPGSNSPLRRSQLWYDDRDIPALRQDEEKKATISKLQAEAVSSLITQGWTPESSRDAVTTGELANLKHTGKPSVQLQKSGNVSENGNAPNEPQPEEVPSGNGNGQGG